MADYVVFENVPILDSGDGITDEQLELVVSVANQRFSDTRIKPTVIIGHTSGDPTAEQKESIGFMVNFRLGQIGNMNPRKCVIVDMHIRASVAAEYEPINETFPYLSVEYWPEDGVMGTVALLGGDCPARNLGPIPPKKDGLVIRYSKLTLKKDLQNMDPTDDFCAKVVEQLLANDDFKTELRKRLSEGEEKPEADDTEDKGDEPEKNEGASGDNTYVPGTDDDDKDKEKHSRTRIERDEARAELTNYSRLLSERDSELAKARQEASKFQRLYLREQREKDLIQLQNEGFSFNRADELDTVSEMSQEIYDKHLNKIRKNYKRAPIGLNVKDVITTKELDDQLGAGGDMQKDDFDACVKLALAKGISFEKAAKEYKGIK